MPNKTITFISSTTFKCMKNELGMKKLPSQHHANETASSTSNDEKGKKFETFLGRAT
jgi:hypothetical protein